MSLKSMFGGAFLAGGLVGTSCGSFKAAAGETVAHSIEYGVGWMCIIALIAIILYLGTNENG